jgi:hypothetical protein
MAQDYYLEIQELEFFRRGGVFTFTVSQLQFTCKDIDSVSCDAKTVVSFTDTTSKDISAVTADCKSVVSYGGVLVEGKDMDKVTADCKTISVYSKSVTSI